MQAPTAIVQTPGPRRALAASDKPRASRFGFPTHRARKSAAVTLIELLCVCAIIAILASLLLPAVSRAYRRARAMQEEFDAPAVFEMLLGATRNYCAANPTYNFESKRDFAEKCRLPPKCGDWIYASPTEFAPFNYLAPTNLVVLTFHYGRNYATTRTFTKAELSIRPDD
jgi:type II secretory pathway pseudopilin PulG